MDKDTMHQFLRVYKNIERVTNEIDKLNEKLVESDDAIKQLRDEIEELKADRQGSGGAQMPCDLNPDICINLRIDNTCDYDGRKCPNL